MKAKTLIRIFALLLFLAAIIAGMAWGGNPFMTPIKMVQDVCLNGEKNVPYKIIVVIFLLKTKRDHTNLVIFKVL